MIYETQVKNLVSNIKKPETPMKLNIILEGGGFNGLYEYGCLLLLKEMEKQKRIIVNKISGASIGGLLGFLYIIDKLDNYTTIYEDIKIYWKQYQNLYIVKEKIETLFKNIKEDKKLNNLVKSINRKLYISYYDLLNKKQIIQNEYKSFDDIKRALLQTSHIPILIDNHFCENIQYIDGGYPYIFSQRDITETERTLYISINQYDKIQNIFRVKEHNSSGRILEGILKCYEIFYTGKKNNLCSFIHNWGYKDYIFLRLKQVAILIVVYILSFFYKVYIAFEKSNLIDNIERNQENINIDAGKNTDTNTRFNNTKINNKYLIFGLKILNNIKQNDFTNKLIYILKETYRDIFLSYCF